jgi:hypothetical protein
MEKLALDTAVADQLVLTGQHVPICNPSGQTLGYFVPAAEHDRELYKQAHALWTDEEIEELSKQTGGITTEELLRRLSEL